MSDFDKAIHVAPDGSSEIVAGWDIGGNANGGYLLALIANHMRALSGRPDPITVTGHYLSPGVAGPVQIDGEVIKSGKRFATVTATMHRDGRPMLQALGTFGDIAFGSGSFEHVAAQPPDLPAIQECVRRSTDQGGTPVPMMEHLDVFIRPADAGFITGTKSGVAEMAGWFAFPDGHVVDTLALLMVCDALPPGVFNLDLPAAWVPTVEYTVHVRGVPAAGPLRCIFRSEAVSNGFLQEDGEVWDSAGQLVAMSRQLALMAR